MRIGNVDLQSHQVSAAYRLRKAIDEFGGAILCDPVGTGKTYVALAISQIDEAVLVVAPAVLRKMWMRASAIAERHVDFVSFESLSRRSAPIGRYALLIVDEAHHVRNPRTIRYEILSRLCTGKDVLMLTATPIHNRRIDLDSLLALFIGSRVS
jgi:superfamily II DNA or RNA helicase